MHSPDTIFALSSGRLPAGVAVVRISGPAAGLALQTMFGRVPPARIAQYGTIRSRNDVAIDRGIALFFPSPNSVTGEDCAEIHLHGGKAVVAAVFQELSDIPRMRHAEAGEFTKRAFLNGKLDLLEAEALVDLIGAETEAQRRLAMRSAGGSQAALYWGWRERLLHAQAMIEAELDFADESDVPGSMAETIWIDMAALVVEIDAHVAGFSRAEIIKEGFQVVILGAPNAGKSTLINALARRPVAIVSDEAGTTRDLIEVALDLDGSKVVFTDTAGIRPDPGKVEAIGIELAMERANQADLVLLLEAPRSGGSADYQIGGVPLWRVATKADLEPDRTGHDFLISVQTGAGMAELLSAISERASLAIGDAGDILPSQARHVELLSQSALALRAALDRRDLDLELRAEELRKAAFLLGRISGMIDPEDMLDVIFSRFCIGK